MRTMDGEHHSQRKSITIASALIFEFYAWHVQVY